MKFNWDPLHLYWHIMIPAKSRPRSHNELYIIAACTDPSIINIRIPGNLGRHIDPVTKEYPNGVEHGYPHEEIELKYSKICPDCINLYDPNKIKFELIVLKLKR